MTLSELVRFMHCSCPCLMLASLLFTPVLCILSLAVLAPISRVADRTSGLAPSNWRAAFKYSKILSPTCATVRGAEDDFVCSFAADLAAGCTFRGLSSMFSSSSSSSSSVSQSLLFFCDTESGSDDGAAVSSLLSVNASVREGDGVGERWSCSLAFTRRQNASREIPKNPLISIS